MASKVSQKELSVDKAKEELRELETNQKLLNRDDKLRDMARFFASRKQWDLALEAFQYIVNENERNLLISELIEWVLLPGHELDMAKKYAKFLTPVPEIQPLVFLRIALAENKLDHARQIAERLPSPLSRNYAYQHIVESYLENKQKDKVRDITKLLLENVRTIFDMKSRSYVLRELALNLFLANHEKELAKEFANTIPDDTIKTQVLAKINKA